MTEAEKLKAEIQATESRLWQLKRDLDLAERTVTCWKCRGAKEFMQLTCYDRHSLGCECAGLNLEKCWACDGHGKVKAA